MATVALDGVDLPRGAVGKGAGFPWRRLLLVWLAISALLVIYFWHAIVTQNYADADDLMRLLEVRDLLGGQSWFDLTQYRLDPPIGLQSHWSRLVDLPLIVLIAPLTPLVGQPTAEMIATAVVPLVILGTTMAAALLAARRLAGHSPLFVLLVPVMIVTASPVLLQMFPTRIDHHGWQICLGTIAFAALLGKRAQRSGLIAGAAIALLMAISIEGLPFAVAITAVLALLWAARRDGSERLCFYLVALAIVSAASFVLTAPTVRWSTGFCDVVKPAHLAVFAFAAAGMAIAARLADRLGTIARIAALAIVGGGAVGLFGLLAPNCLGSPFGAMDPLVHRFWYENVLEGLPVTRQSIDVVPIVLIFPVIGMVGAILAWREAADDEHRRRWLLAITLGAATFLLGALVLRETGLAHIVAIPGALALIERVRPRVAAIGLAVVRVPLTALMIIVLTPLLPMWIGTTLASDHAEPKTGGCDWRCGMTAIDRLPQATMFTEVDIAPRLIEATHHRAYAGGYHRLETPLHRTIEAFIGTPETARAIICGGQFDDVLISPASGESKVYRKASPRGFLAQLVAGKTPSWLTPIALPTRELRLYRVDRGPACHS